MTKSLATSSLGLVFSFHFLIIIYFDWSLYSPKLYLLHEKQRLHGELPNARVEQISNCGHLPHVEKPAAVAKLIAEFVRETCQLRKEAESIS